MSNINQDVKAVLDQLNDEFGDETFVGDGYGYYDAALNKFTNLLRTVRAEHSQMKEALKIIGEKPGPTPTDACAHSCASEMLANASLKLLVDSEQDGAE